MKSDIGNLLDQAESALSSGSSGRRESETSFLQRLLREIGQDGAMANMSPAGLFRAVRDGSLIKNAQNVLQLIASPSQQARGGLRSGDWMLRVIPGTGDVGHLSVLATDDLLSESALASEGIAAESAQPGYYGVVIEAGAFPHSRAQPYARRLLDRRGRVLPNTVFLRPLMPQLDEPMTGGDWWDTEATPPAVLPPPRGTTVTLSGFQPDVSVLCPPPPVILEQFNFDNDNLKAAHRTRIGTLAQEIVDSQTTADPIHTLCVLGHTDSVGGDGYNADLAARRAIKVAAELEAAIEAKQTGLSATLGRTVESRGEESPLVPNTSTANRARNRRVEIFLNRRWLRTTPGGYFDVEPALPPEVPEVGALRAATDVVEAEELTECPPVEDFEFAEQAVPQPAPAPAAGGADSSVASRFVAAHSSRFCTPGQAGSATCRGLTSPRAIRRVVVHVLAVPSTSRRSGVEAVVAGWQDAGRLASSHYLVDRDGTITQMVRESNVAFHTPGNNADSIGIEHADVCNDPSPLTTPLYERSAALVRDLSTRHRFAINANTVAGHSQVNPNHGDPGPYWDWEYFFLLLAWDGVGGATRPLRVVVAAASMPAAPAGWQVRQRRAIANDRCANQRDPWGATYWRAQPAASGIAAELSLVIDEAGTYKVSLWWPDVSGANPAVRVEVEIGALTSPGFTGSTQSVTVNQRPNSGRWNDVAVVTAPQAPAEVKVRWSRSSAAGGWILVDAVRLLKISSTPQVTSAGDGESEMEVSEWKALEEGLTDEESVPIRRDEAYVRWIQESLNQVSGAGLTVDGTLNPQTEGAIRKFQQERSLVVDGVVGPITEGALIDAGATAPPPLGSELSAPSEPSGEPRIDPRDERVDVSAKFALQRMVKRSDMRTDAVRLIDGINSGKLAGIFGDDLQATVRLAQRHGTQRWLLVPKGEDAALVLDVAEPLTTPPTIVFRRLTSNTMPGKAIDPKTAEPVRSGQEFGVRDPKTGQQVMTRDLPPERLDAALQQASQTFELWQGRQLGPCASSVSATPVPNLVPSSFCRVQAVGLVTKGSLEVLVSNKSTGQPIAEANVTLAGIESRAAQTDGSGKAFFEQLTPGDYTVSITKKGFRPKTTSVSVAPGKASPEESTTPNNQQSFVGEIDEAGSPGGTRAVVSLQPLPKITSFQVQTVTPSDLELPKHMRTVPTDLRKPTAPGDRAIVFPGQRVKFHWTLEAEPEKGVELALFGSENEQQVITPGEPGVTGTLKQGTFEADPGTFPPNPDGRYRLAFFEKDDPFEPASQPFAEVTVLGISNFAIEGQDPAEDRLFKKDGKTTVERVVGQPGSYRKLENTEFFGQVKVRANVTYFWRVLGPKKVRVELDVNHQQNGRLIQDLTEKTRADKRGDGNANLSDVNRFNATFLEADLTVFEDKIGTKGPELAVATIRLRENRPLPFIADFGGFDLARGQHLVTGAEVQRWEDVRLLWRLDGDSVLTRLVLKVEELRPGQPPIHLFTPAEPLKASGDKAKEGSFDLKQAINPKFPDQFKGPMRCRATADLLQVNGQPAAPPKTFEFRIADPKQPPSPPRPALLTLRDVLGQLNGSLLHQAVKNGFSFTVLKEFDDPNKVLEAVNTRADADRSTNTKFKPIWAWKHDPSLGLNEVQDVRCRVRSADLHQFQVLDSVHWENVSVTPKGSGSPVPLPLTKDFVLKKLQMNIGANLPGGGKHAYWKLRAMVDQSMMLVFGYKIEGGKTLKPDFDYDTQGWIPLSPAPVPTGVKARTTPVAAEDPLRVAVCISLVCCMERADFEPGGVMEAGRLYPHAYIVANHDLEEAQISIVLKRPLKTRAIDMPAHHHHPGHEEMKPEIEGILFTDTNSKRTADILEAGARAAGILLPPPFKVLAAAPLPKLFVPLPIWNNLFDYYDISGGPKPEFFAVQRGAAVGNVPTVECLRFGPPQFPPLPYKRFRIEKVPGQGDFDNVHLAPKMILDPTGSKSPLTHAKNQAKFIKFPVKDGSGKVLKSWGLEDVGMAPFCLHDCLHTHWRWSTEFTDPTNRGWSRDFDPYSTAGAPLVPHNQEVKIALPSAATLQYSAIIHNPEAGRLQVVNHHGSAYALNLDNAIEKVSRGGIDLLAATFAEPELEDPRKLPPGPLRCTDSFAFFYWRLRFGGTPDQPMERLRFTAAELKSFREHRVT